MKINGVHHVTLTVTDMDRAKAFYMDIMDFEMMAELSPRRILLSNNNFFLAVGLSPDESQAVDGDRFNENRVGLDHVSFAVDSRADLDAAIKKFDENNVSHGEIKDLSPHGMPFMVLAFRDPDNIQLELIAPAG